MDTDGTLHVHPALDIGGTHVTAALVELGPKPTVDPPTVTHLHREPLPSAGTATEIIDAITTCARRVPAPAGAAWGVAIPGPFDYRRGIGLFRGVAKFEALYGVPLGDTLRLRLPGPGPIRFLNDAEAFLRGEWGAGAARGHDRVAGITLGTGIGSAFLDRGEPVEHGPEVPPEGRADLLRIDGAPLEDTISSRAIVAGYRRETGEELDVRGITGRARSGDPAAARVLDTAFRALGRALAPWLVAFRASVLVVGGGMVASWDVIRPPLSAGLDEAADGPLPTTLVAHHPEQAPLIGAALLADQPAPTDA